MAWKLLIVLCVLIVRRSDSLFTVQFCRKSVVDHRLSINHHSLGVCSLVGTYLNATHRVHPKIAILLYRLSVLITEQRAGVELSMITK